MQEVGKKDLGVRIKDELIDIEEIKKTNGRKMNDSGVEWIGEVPEDWQVLPLGQFFEERNEKVSEYDFEPLSVTKKGIVKQLDNAAKSSNRDNRKKVCINDFVINSRSDRKQSCGLSPYNGSVSVINIVLKNKILELGFVKYLLDNYGFAEEFYRWGTGIVDDLWSTRYDKMKRIMLPIPPKFEQQKIGNYLDKKVSLIDHTIEKTKESIEEYEKYKQALITETVTKGLNPDVEMKQSGIEWVGEVPKHWRIIRIKHLATVNPNKSEIKHLSLDSEVTFIPMEKIIGPGQVDYSLSNTIENLINGYTYFKDGDIIMAKVTPCFENSNIAIVNGMKNGIGFGTTELHILRCNDKCYNKYLFYYLQSSVFVLKGISKMYGIGGLKRVSEDFVSNHKLAVPSYEEQKQIAGYLDKKCLEIGKIISQKEQLIKKLEDYKKSLIYEYVTGKKRVV